MSFHQVEVRLQSGPDGGADVGIPVQRLERDALLVLHHERNQFTDHLVS